MDEEERAILPETLEIGDETPRIPDLLKLVNSRNTFALRKESPKRTEEELIQESLQSTDSMILSKIDQLPVKQEQKIEFEEKKKETILDPIKDISPLLWEKIFSYLTKKEIASIRLICKEFNQFSQTIYDKLKLAHISKPEKEDIPTIIRRIETLSNKNISLKRKEKRTNQSSTFQSSQEIFFNTLRELKNLHDSIGLNIKDTEHKYWNTNVFQMREFLDRMNVSFAEVKDGNNQLIKKLQENLSKQGINFIKLEEGSLMELTDENRKKQNSHLEKFSELSRKLYSSIEGFLEFPNDRDHPSKISERIHAMRDILFEIETTSPFPTHIIHVANDIQSYLATIKFIMMTISTSLKTKTESTINLLIDAMEHQISQAFEFYSDISDFEIQTTILSSALKMEQLVPKLNEMKFSLEEAKIDFVDKIIHYSVDMKKAGADDHIVQSLLEHLQRQLSEISNTLKPSKQKWKNAISDLESKFTTLKVQCLSEKNEVIQSKNLDYLNRFESIFQSIEEVLYQPGSERKVSGMLETCKSIIFEISMKSPASKEISIHTATVNNSLLNIENLIFGVTHKKTSIIRAAASKSLEFLRRQAIIIKQLLIQRISQDQKINIPKLEEALKILGEILPKVWSTMEQTLYDPNYRDDQFSDLFSRLEKLNTNIQVIAGNSPQVGENTVQILAGLETLTTNFTFGKLYQQRDSLLDDLFSKASEFIVSIKNEAVENSEGEKLMDIAFTLENSLRSFSGLSGETNPTTSFIAHERLFEITAEIRVNISNVSKIANSNTFLVSGCLSIVDKLSRLASLIAEIEQLTKSNWEQQTKTISNQLSKLSKLKNQGKEMTVNSQLDVSIKELSGDLAVGVVAGVQERLHNVGDEDSLQKIREIFSSIKKNLHITEKYGNKKLIHSAKGIGVLLENLSTLIFGEKSELEKMIEMVVKKIAQLNSTTKHLTDPISMNRAKNLRSQLQHLVVSLIQITKQNAENNENPRKPLYELVTNIEETSWNLQSVVKDKISAIYTQEITDSLNALVMMIGELTCCNLEVCSEVFIWRISRQLSIVDEILKSDREDHLVKGHLSTAGADLQQNLPNLVKSMNEFLDKNRKIESFQESKKILEKSFEICSRINDLVHSNRSLQNNTFQIYAVHQKIDLLSQHLQAILAMNKTASEIRQSLKIQIPKFKEILLENSTLEHVDEKFKDLARRIIMDTDHVTRDIVDTPIQSSDLSKIVPTDFVFRSMKVSGSEPTNLLTTSMYLIDESIVHKQDEKEVFQESKKIFDEMQEGNIEDQEYSQNLLETMGEWINDFDFLESSGIFQSEFFILEIERLKLKFHYDESRIDNKILGTGRIPISQRPIDDLINLALMNEEFAMAFGERYESEWGRKLALNAISLRKLIFSKIIPDQETEETTPLSEDEAKLSDDQLMHLDRDWELFVDLCLNGEPFTDTKNESGILQTLELLDIAFDLAPIHLADARTPQMVTLWEAKVLKVIKLYEMQRKQGTASAIVENFFLPVLKQIPFYLERENNVLGLLWNSILFIYEEQHKGDGQQTLKLEQFLLTVHQFCVEKMAFEDLPTTVISAFPLFPEVCKLLSNMHLSKKEYIKAQEYAIEEMTMYLELDENPRDNEKMLGAWERVFSCVQKTKTKTSEQFFLLRDILSEIQVYDNNALKDAIQKYMNNIGGSKEVRYIIRYSEQLKRCSKVFFGSAYSDYSNSMDEASLLEEILFNLNNCEGNLEDLLVELRILADYNQDFQTELMKAKEFEKAKKVIEDNLKIRKFTDPAQLTKQGTVIIDPKSLQSYETLIECCIEFTHKASKSPISMQTLRSCYDSRPSYFPFENLLLKKLWQEMVLLSEFHKETLESLYKKYCIDKQKLFDFKRIGSEKRNFHKGFLVMRINKTWQERFVYLQEQALFFSKSEKALRSRGILPLDQLTVKEEMPESIKDVIPEEAGDNLFVMVTPWRDYVVFARNSEEKMEWLRKIDEFKNTINHQENILKVESEVNKELLARHPLILEVLTHLGTLWEKQGYTEEALVLFIQGLEITVHMNNLQILERLWNLIYKLLTKTKNIYEILEFLEEENDRWLTHGLEADHILLRLISQSIVQIQGEEDLKLRYMYQIRKYKEISDDIFPGRIYYLNQIYVMMFLQNGSLTEAIALTKDSLSLLKRHLESDDLIAYYHLNTWHLLVDLYLTYSKEKERQNDYYGGRIMLQSAFYDLPNKLDPFNERLNLVLDEIYQLYNTDPETQPDPQTALTDTAAFSWMHSLYLDYDDHLMRVYPSEALANRSTSLNYRKAIDKNVLNRRLDDFKDLIRRFPYMMNICSKLSKDYYLSHQLELALHMARHSLHVMAASMSTRHREISQQWQFCKKCFLAQRHSNIEFKKFIEEEIILASVFVNESHPHLIRLKQDLNKIESKIAIFEKYIPAVIYYAIYAAIFSILIFYVPKQFPASYSQLSSNLTTYIGLWIFMIIANLDFMSILISMVFVRWPPLPPDSNHRASSTISRSQKLKDVGLVISCSNARATLPATLRAALKVFPPEQIFVSDNGDSEKPIDQTQDICFKITQEYRSQYKLSVDSPSINYLWCSEKSKSLSYWWACKYYCKYKYCMLIDENVFLPGDLIVPMEIFEDEKIKCLTFTLCANNMFNQKGQAINISYWQDMDLKIDGFIKMFWSYLCTAFAPNFSASIWERSVFLETISKHTDPERGNDILLGQIFHKLNRDLRIATVGNVSIPITVPDHIICRGIFQCKCHGKEKQGNLFSKVIQSDYINAFQFQYHFFSLLFFYWTRAAIFLKPFILYELISLFRNSLTFPLWCFFIYKNPVQFGMINSVFFGIQIFLILTLNYWILRGRPDMQHPFLICITYPVYLWGITLFRFIAMLYNRFYHLPMIRDKLEFFERQDLPVDPNSMRVFQKMGEADSQPSNNVPVPELLLQKDSHEWEIVAKLLEKESETTPHLSHWFLSCVSQIVWKKETPRKQVTFSSRLRKRKSILGRTENFFYWFSAQDKKEQIIPFSFLTALNAMCFLTRKPQTLGVDSTKSFKILKWLWIEDKLGDSVRNNQRLLSYLKEFQLKCISGITLVDFSSFIRGVVMPNLMFMNVPSDISSSILHLQPVFDQRSDSWLLQGLAFTTSSAEETVITRNFKPGSLKQISAQPFVVFTPVPNNDTTIIDPFKTQVVHTAFFADPIEGWILITDPRGMKESVQGRMGAVLSLLSLSERKFKEIYLLQPSGKIVLISWEEIQTSAERFYSENIAKQARATNKKLRKNLRPSTALARKNIGELVEHPQNESMQLIMNFITNSENSNGIINHRLHSSSGLWLIPVIDVINGPIIFINNEGEHIDSEIFFEPWIKLLNSDHQIKTRPTSALKKRAINYAITGRALGGIFPKSQRSSQNEEKTPLTTFLFKMEDSFDKLQFDFQLLNFSNHIMIQNTLSDYLWYVVKKKEQQKQITEEAEKKLMERVEAIKQREKEAAKVVKFDPVFTGSEKTNPNEDDFLNEAEHFVL